MNKNILVSEVPGGGGGGARWAYPAHGLILLSTNKPLLYYMCDITRYLWHYKTYYIYIYKIWLARVMYEHKPHLILLTSK